MWTAYHVLTKFWLTGFVGGKRGERGGDTPKIRLCKHRYDCILIGYCTISAPRSTHHSKIRTLPCPVAWICYDANFPTFIWLSAAIWNSYTSKFALIFFDCASEMHFRCGLRCRFSTAYVLQGNLDAQRFYCLNFSNFFRPQFAP